LDNTTEIHTNDGDCKGSINKEIEKKKWAEAFVAHICLGRLRKTTINLSPGILKYYLRSLLDQRRKSMKIRRQLLEPSFV
jgi:hypothetical protein